MFNGVTTHIDLCIFPLVLGRCEAMNLTNQAGIERRKVTGDTRAGQYMCPECGKIFDTKQEVDNHIRKKHHLKSFPKGVYNTLDIE